MKRIFMICYYDRRHVIDLRSIDQRLLLCSSLFSSLVSSFMGMLCVAFVTLLERKILGIGQERTGPVKWSLFGMLQPFIDVFKLLSKFFMFPVKSSFLFLSFPLFGVSLMLVFWSGLLSDLLRSSSSFFFVFILCITRVAGLVLLVSGWRSVSAYSSLGGIRALIQFLSYEISSSFLWFSLFSLSGWYLGFSLSEFSGLWVLLFTLVGFLFLLTVVAERQRAPFDFAEGESELVSGFNTEYSSLLFAIIFLSEYGLLLFFSWLLSLLFFSSVSLVVLFMSVHVAGFIILVRGSYPRLRFDLLQFVAWKALLPVSMVFLALLFLLCVRSLHGSFDSVSCYPSSWFKVPSFFESQVVTWVALSIWVWFWFSTTIPFTVVTSVCLLPSVVLGLRCWVDMVLSFSTLVWFMVPFGVLLPVQVCVHVIHVRGVISDLRVVESCQLDF